MDPNQFQQPDANRHGANPPYQVGLNPYMFMYQTGPSAWNPNQVMHPGMHPQAATMTPLTATGMFPMTAAGMPPPNAGGMHPHMSPQLQHSSSVDQMNNPLDDEVEEVATVGGPSNGGRKIGASGIKLSNFVVEEDVNIVRSWLEISCDPIVNTGQKRDNFWDRVMKQYNGRRGSWPERTLRSVQSHWDKIKQEATKFAGYVAAAIRGDASGTSDANKTTLAASNFAGVEGYKFQFMHCWDLLKDEPKWQDVKQKSSKTAGTDELGEHIPPGSNTIDLDGDKPSPGATGKRPIGRDAAKARKKMCPSGSTSSSEYASKLEDLSLQKMTMWQEENAKKVDRFDHLASIEEKRFDEMREHNKSILQLEEEKIKFMRDKLNMQMQEKEREILEREKQEDERILKVDLDSCTPDLRMYYEVLREEILHKVVARKQRNHQL